MPPRSAQWLAGCASGPQAPSHTQRLASLSCNPPAHVSTFFLHRTVAPPRRSKFQEVLGWPAPPPPLVLRQLCVLLAAAAGSGGGEGAAELVAQAKALLGPATALGLELLTAVADEAEDLDRVRRLALVNVLAPFVREVLDVLGQLLAQALKQLPGGWRRAQRGVGSGDAWPQGLACRGRNWRQAAAGCLARVTRSRPTCGGECLRRGLPGVQEPRSWL